MTELLWRIADDGIVLGEILEISLQRTLASASSVHDPPPSYGRAPLAAVQDIVLAGIGTGELFWIGFQPLKESTQIAVRVRGELPRDVDLVNRQVRMPVASHDPRSYLIVPPQRHLSTLGPENRRLWIEIVGVRSGSVADVPTNVESAGWTTLADTGVRVEVLPAAEFSDVTGMTPRPLEESDRYHGRRYP
jgi:hypothetical protein